jgi:hypothetical protein
MHPMRAWAAVYDKYAGGDGWIASSMTALVKYAFAPPDKST